MTTPTMIQSPTEDEIDTAITEHMRYWIGDDFAGAPDPYTAMLDMYQTMPLTHIAERVFDVLNGQSGDPRADTPLVPITAYGDTHDHCLDLLLVADIDGVRYASGGLDPAEIIEYPTRSAARETIHRLINVSIEHMNAALARYGLTPGPDQTYDWTQDEIDQITTRSDQYAAVLRDADDYAADQIERTARDNGVWRACPFCHWNIAPATDQCSGDCGITMTRSDVEQYTPDGDCRECGSSGTRCECAHSVRLRAQRNSQDGQTFEMTIRWIAEDDSQAAADRHAILDGIQTSDAFPPMTGATVSDPRAI